MAITPDSSEEDTPLSLDERLKMAEEKLAQSQKENDWLRRQLGLATHKRFGASSEKTIDPEQAALLFDEAEVTEDPDTPEPTDEQLEQISYTRRKAKGKREADLEGLPVEVVRHELPENERSCGVCSHPLHEIGTENSNKLRVIPPQVSVVQHQQVKYGCRHCEKTDVSAGVTLCKMPPVAFPGSLASPSAVGFIVSQKFEMGLPLYRQEKYFEGLGIPLSRATMANWMIKGAQVLIPVYEHMQSVLRRQEVLHADETTLQVLHEKERNPGNQSYMWVYCSGRDGPPVALYDYQMTRGGMHPRTFLEGFSGYLHVDGYGAYDSLPGITLSGCWAHARRKFDEALKASGVKSSVGGGNRLARTGLEFCNKLFAVERSLQDASPEHRLAMRLERSRPILDEFHCWLEANQITVLPKSHLGVAVQYCLNQWPKLIVFLRDGRLELDNNRCERAVKPFVIGRKNWLFANTPKGARSSAILYSMVETAKINGITPLSYLTLLFEKLPLIDITDAAKLEELMPWSPSVQDAAVCVGKG